MHKENVQTIYDIYENDAARDQCGSSGHLLTGIDSVKIRISRAALVCLVLLCFLLLTAVIVLSVLIYTNNTQERELLTNLTEERNKLTLKTINLLIERDQFKFKNGNLTNQLNNTLVDGWTYYQFSFYYAFNETKSWTESRRDCQQRGADLVIINNRQEQDFVMSFTRGKECWIGLTDSEVEGRWKWVDGTNTIFGMWASGEPNGGTAENCVVTYFEKAPYLLGWIDEICYRVHQYICEKNILPLIQP